MKPWAPASWLASSMYDALMAEQTTTRARGASSLSCGQQLEAADVGHVQVEQDQVGLRLLDRQGQRLVGVAGGADDVEALAGQGHAHQLAQVVVVVDDEQADPLRLRLGRPARRAPVRRTRERRLDRVGRASSRSRRPKIRMASPPGRPRDCPGHRRGGLPGARIGGVARRTEVTG